MFFISRHLLLAIFGLVIALKAQGLESDDALAKINRLVKSKDPKQWDVAVEKLAPIVGNDATATPSTLRLFIDVCIRTKRPEFMAQARQACAKLCKMKDGRSAIYGDLGLLRCDRADGKELTTTIELARAVVERYKTESGAVEAAYFLGSLYEDNSQFKEAKNSFIFGRARLIELTSKSYYFGELSDSEFAAALKRLPKAEKPKKKVDPRKAHEPKATFDQAEQFRKDLKWQEARLLYDKIVHEYDGEPLAEASEYYRALMHFNENKPDVAFDLATEFIQSEPLGPWRGHAHLLLGDILLEFRFDAASAEDEYQTVLTGKRPAKKKPAGMSLVPSKKPPEPAAAGNAEPDVAPYDANWKLAHADSHERLGICLFVRKDFEGAEAHFETEMKLRPMRPFGEGQIPSNMKFLLEMARQKKYPVPYDELVMRGDSRINTIIFLGSAHSEIGNYDKALMLYDRLQSKEYTKLVSPVQREYAAWEEAEIRRLKLDFPAAVAGFKHFEKQYAKSVFAPKALLDLGSLYSAEGKLEDALSTYARIYRNYSSSPEAPKGLYFHGFVQYVKKDYEEALKDYVLLASNYPKSWEAQRVLKHEIPEFKQLIEKKEMQTKKNKEAAK